MTEENIILKDYSDHENRIFNHLMKSSPIITYVFTLDKGHNYTFVSDNIRKILGYEKNEFISDDFWVKNLHPADRIDIEYTIGQHIKLGRGNLEYRFRHSNGSYLWMLDHHQVIKEKGVSKEVIGTWLDISENNEIRKKLEYKASHDDITGLINREEFRQRLDDVFSWSDTVQHVLCYIDIDQFKIINNSLGHIAGNALLKQLARLFKDTLSKRDLLAYMGGDEFAVLFQHCTLNQAYRVLQKIQDALQEFRFNWDDKYHISTASMGLVAIDKNTNRQQDILNVAISACEAAQEEGSGKVHVYSDKDGILSEKQKEMFWVERVNRALEEDRFVLYYQPIVSLNKNIDEKHFELLIRMKNKEEELIPPGLFLPAVERYGLAAKIDRWVIQTTFSWLETYPEYFKCNYSWSINLSGQSLADSQLLQFVDEELYKKKIPPEKICFEITETAAIADLSNATHFINALRGKGCKFALDDFGSGLSSFAYLKNLSVDFLKIDGVFVKGMVEDNIDYAMVKAIHEVGHSMGKRTIAEFVEDMEIAEKLKDIGVDYAQGYGIARPMSLAEFSKNEKGSD